MGWMEVSGDANLKLLFHLSMKKMERKRNMTITFKVCNIEEELNKDQLEPFKIEDFIEVKISGSYGELPTSLEIYEKEFKDRGLPYRECNEQIEERLKEYENEKEKFIENKLKKKKVLGSSLTENGNQIVGSSNSFIYSAWDAYNNHHHLEIRPDNIWMAIISQFSFYVNKYYKELDDIFVDFRIEDGKKKELTLVSDYPILDAPFDKLVMEMVEQIGNNIKDPSIKDWIIAEFSTTTPSDKVAFGSALMSITKKYYFYSMRSRCGLPKVTLNGTVEDWINLKERAIRLKEFNNKEDHMNKWLSYLLPILDNFIESSRGNPNTKWWNKIVDFRSRSGGGILTGWLSAFCLFNEDGDYEDDVPFTLCLDKTETIWPKVSQDHIPYGYTSTPISLTDFSGTKFNSTIYSGHITKKIDGTKFTPLIDWFIIADLS
ncbi:hypothetical protein ACTA71_000686 [Dictyostelium dimigraforme]